MRLLLVSCYALVALGVLGASPAAAQSGAPVTATSCRGGVTSIELVEHAAYDTTFHNAANVAVDDFHVAIPYGRHGVAFFDVRSPIAPGGDVTVHLHKNLKGGLFADESDRNACNVRYVHFVDGTTWGSATADN